VPLRRCFTFPLAVIRNLFFVPLCVFCFGIVNWSLTSSVNAILFVAAYIREVFLIDDVVVLFWGQCADKSASSLLG
jgi:hypothetical protein